MKKIIDILEEIDENIDYNDCKGLISKNIFDSFQLTLLIVAIEEEYGIKTKPFEINATNFDSISLIEKFIKERENV